MSWSPSRPGFGDRLLSEVKKLSPKDIKIKISAPQERTLTTWIGFVVRFDRCSLFDAVKTSGSILASLDTFKKMWVSKREYEEDSRVLNRKTFL